MDIYFGTLKPIHGIGVLQFPIKVTSHVGSI